MNTVEQAALDLSNSALSSPSGPDTPSPVLPPQGVEADAANMTVEATVVEAVRLDTPVLRQAGLLLEVAKGLGRCLWQGEKLEWRSVAEVMTQTCGGSDAAGVWTWKEAYNAQELAVGVMLPHLFERFSKARLNAIQVLEKVAILEGNLLTQTRRSERGNALQQFSTPPQLAFLATTCARVTATDVVLEPSAGTGMLAHFCALKGAGLVLNELDEGRRALLQVLYPTAGVTGFNGEHLNDLLDDSVRPSVVVLNPPFSASPRMEQRNPDATGHHVRQAFLRLREGGRMVAITGHWFRPGSEFWTKAFHNLPHRVVATVVCTGEVYAKHGTTMTTRLTVIDKVELGKGIPTELELTAESVTVMSRGQPRSVRMLNVETVAALLRQIPPRAELKAFTLTAPQRGPPVSDLSSSVPATVPTTVPTTASALVQSARTSAWGFNLPSLHWLLDSFIQLTQPLMRLLTEAVNKAEKNQSKAQKGQKGQKQSKKGKGKQDGPVTLVLEDVVPVTYEAVPDTQASTTDLDDRIYEVYSPQRIQIEGAHPHPSLLCESVALNAVLPPLPSYQPYLPRSVVDSGILSAAQLESVIYAGEAHSQFLSGHYTLDEQGDTLSPATPGQEGAVRFRQGWFLGDGTGAGKGRQVAGVILDNWCQGRTRAVWVSKSDKLLEDARRDWAALGGDPRLVVPLQQFKASDPIRLEAGILFATYATLRSRSRATGDGKAGRSRLEQIVDWAGVGFEGVIAFDEAHAMGNAVASQGSRGLKDASQQGLMGLRLQNLLAQARVLYVSATGATEVSHLAYASRLGLWGTGEMPFENRSAFISNIEAGGVGAMEVVARDLKALGLYLARNLSFDGVEYDPLEVPLTPQQVEIYNLYADAYQVIHQHLQEALQVCGITVGSGEVESRGAKTLNGQAKSAAMAAFEGNKQRFFGHLLCAMKCPALIRAMEQDLASERSVVIQIVSTNEEVMKRKLETVPVEEWQDLHVDVTPREYVIDYLARSFPVHRYEQYTTEEGELRSELLMTEEGTPVLCQEAVLMRDGLIESLCSLPPLPGALDQLLHHFGHEMISEVTGRSVRIVKHSTEGRLLVQKRSATANLEETQAFMAGLRRILVFSDAGGTGRSYHADLGCGNTQRRVHYLLEPGWRADNAVQGLGRSHRTNQAIPPVFRPVVTQVHGERRFISTIARRLDALGALTKGQRQTGGQGLFDPKDNLESDYARQALVQFWEMLVRGQVPCCSLGLFQQMTGLSLLTEEGLMRSDLPTIQQFLNRLMALRIERQHELFSFFDLLLNSGIERAVEAGTYEVGVETLRAHCFRVQSRRVIYTHGKGSESHCVELLRQDRTPKPSAEVVMQRYPKGIPVANERSGKVALQIPTSSVVEAETGAILERVALIRPRGEDRLTLEQLKNSHWQPITEAAFAQGWTQEMAQVPEFTESTLFLTTGLLLPIWKVLGTDSLRVFRLQTHEGERLLGRLVSPERMVQMAAALGLEQTTRLAAPALFEFVLHQGQRYDLDGIQGQFSLQRRRVAGTYRLEVMGIFSTALREQFKALGCFSEVIQYDTRLFVPTDTETGVATLLQLLDWMQLAPASADGETGDDSGGGTGTGLRAAD